MLHKLLHFHRYVAVPFRVILHVILYIVIATNMFPSTDSENQKQSSLDTKRTYMWPRQSVYVKRNNEARRCNHCYRGKEINTTYCKYMFVALGIEHAMCMCHLWNAPLCKMSPIYIIINGTIFEEKQLLNSKCVFWLPRQLFFWNILRRIQRDVIKKNRYSCPILIKLQFSQFFF